MMQVKNGKGRMPRLLATGLAALLLAGCGADRDGGKATATASGDGAPAPAYFDWFEYTGRDAAFEAPVPDGSFRNPVLSGFHSDPAVTAANGKFYLVASTFTFFPGIPRAIFMDQGFGAHIIIRGLMIRRRSPSHPGLAHPFVGHQVLALSTGDLIADFRRRLLLVKLQLSHRAHAIFVVIYRLGLRSAVRTS